MFGRCPAQGRSCGGAFSPRPPLLLMLLLLELSMLLGSGFAGSDSPNRSVGRDLSVDSSPSLRDSIQGGTSNRFSLGDNSSPPSTRNLDDGHVSSPSSPGQPSGPNSSPSPDTLYSKNGEILGSSKSERLTTTLSFNRFGVNGIGANEDGDASIMKNPRSRSFHVVPSSPGQTESTWSGPLKSDGIAAKAEVHPGSGSGALDIVHENSDDENAKQSASRSSSGSDVSGIVDNAQEEQKSGKNDCSLEQRGTTKVTHLINIVRSRGERLVKLEANMLFFTGVALGFVVKILTHAKRDFVADIKPLHTLVNLPLSFKLNSIGSGLVLYPTAILLLHRRNFHIFPSSIHWLLKSLQSLPDFALKCVRVVFLLFVFSASMQTVHALFFSLASFEERIRTSIAGISSLGFLYCTVVSPEIPETLGSNGNKEDCSTTPSDQASDTTSSELDKTSSTSSREHIVTRRSSFLK